MVVQKAGRGWKVVLNPDVMPKLRINDLYANAIRQHGDAARALSYIKIFRFPKGDKILVVIPNGTDTR